MSRDRGQAYTLEGVIAAIVVASAVLYGLQAVNVAPWATSSDERSLESTRDQAADLLGAAADRGVLRQIVTCIDRSTGGPHPGIALPPGDTAAYPDGRNATEFGYMLNETLGSNGYRYAVYFEHWNESADRVESTLVYPDTDPTPTRNTVTATYPVTVFDQTDVRSGRNCETVSGHVDGTNPLYLSEAEGSGGSSDPQTFSVVEVRLVVW